jgi:hypothetical protein
MQPRLGYFDDEQEAARAFDTAARRLRGDEAHGGRAGGKNWYRLNFPTEREVKRADARGLLTEEDKAAAAAATSAWQGPSAFVGVSWKKDRRKWRAQIKHEGAVQYLGSFNDEREAALAVDTAARRLRLRTSVSIRGHAAGVTDRGEDVRAPFGYRSEGER